jgi:HK97 family phage portal protein
LSTEQRRDFQDRVAETQGAINAGRAMVLDPAMDFVTFGSMSGQDAQILQSRQWSVVDIARIFQVPPVLIGDWSSARGPIATEALQLFVSTTLRSWVVKFEAAFNASVFGASTGARFAIELDLSALMRADPAQHVAADNVLLSHGVLTPNEVREAWGYSPSDAPGMDDPRQAPQASDGHQVDGTQPGGTIGADGTGGA